MAYGEEVYFCAKCRRQQQPKEGENCKVCGKRTVSWRDGESEAAAISKWEQVNG